MDSKELKYLVIFLSVIAIIGFGFSALVGYASAKGVGLFDLHLCFTNDCLDYFIKQTQNAINIASSTLVILVSVATIGGIIVALLSYLNNSHTSALSNHIAHFSIFRDYLNNEIANLNMISSSSIDILSFYNYIFNKSRSGKTDVSPKYIEFVVALNDEIGVSNGKAKEEVNGSFRYKDHQRRIIENLKGAGISMTYLPRNDFHDAEGQVFSLIDKVSQSFCYTGSVPIIVKRVYI